MEKVKKRETHPFKTVHTSYDKFTRTRKSTTYDTKTGVLLGETLTVDDDLPVSSVDVKSKYRFKTSAPKLSVLGTLSSLLSLAFFAFCFALLFEGISHNGDFSGFNPFNYTVKVLDITDRFFGTRNFGGQNLLNAFTNIGEEIADLSDTPNDLFSFISYMGDIFEVIGALINVIVAFLASAVQFLLWGCAVTFAPFTAVS